MLSNVRIKDNELNNDIVKIDHNSDAYNRNMKGSKLLLMNVSLDRKIEMIEMG